MIAAAFVAGMILSFTLAWQGLIGPGLRASSTRSVPGGSAKVAGGLCAVFGFALLGGIAWAVLQMME